MFSDGIDSRYVRIPDYGAIPRAHAFGLRHSMQIQHSQGTSPGLTRFMLGLLGMVFEPECLDHGPSGNMQAWRVIQKESGRTLFHCIPVQHD